MDGWDVKKELVTKLEKVMRKIMVYVYRTSVELSTILKTGAARDLHCARVWSNLKGDGK